MGVAVRGSSLPWPQKLSLSYLAHGNYAEMLKSRNKIKHGKEMKPCITPLWASDIGLDLFGPHVYTKNDDNWLTLHGRQVHTLVYQVQWNILVAFNSLGLLKYISTKQGFPYSMVSRKGINGALFGKDLGLASEPKFNTFSFVPV